MTLGDTGDAQQATISSAGLRPWLGWLAMGIVVVAGWVAGSQGWRGYLPDLDMAPYFSSAMSFRQGGPVPYRGDISSFGALNPPGVAWLILPGLAATNDISAAQLVGAGLLYLLTILGVFLLARAAANLLTAVIAAALYGWSALALATAASLWPRNPTPCFAIWTALLLWLWVERGKGIFLALAVLVWGLGMYVFPEIAPLILVVPVLWWRRRAPISWGWLLAIGLVLAGVWYPYLRFEKQRDLLDVKSLVLRRPIFSGNFADALCNPSLTLTAYENGAWRPYHSILTGGLADGPGHSGMVSTMIGKAGAAVSGVVNNFTTASGRPPLGLLLLLPAGWLIGVAGSSSTRLRRVVETVGDAPRLEKARRIVAVAAIVAAMCVNPWTISRMMGRSFAFTSTSRMNLCLAEAGLFILALLLLSRGLRRAAGRVFPAGVKFRGMATLLTILIVPWVVLLFLLQPGRADRVVQLWPMQAIVVAAGWLGFRGSSEGTGSDGSSRARC